METQPATQSTEISHFDVTEAALSEIRKYTELTISGLEDKAGYENVRVALRDVVSIRNKVVKRRQDIKRQIDNGAKYILDNLAPVEAHLQGQKDVIDTEKERIKEAEKERRQKQFLDRTGQLFALGFQFNGSIYTLGEMMLSVADIHERDADQWDSTIHHANEVAAAIAEAKAAAEAKAKAEQEAKDREIEALRKQLAELKKEDPAPVETPNPLKDVPAIEVTTTSTPIATVPSDPPRAFVVASATEEVSPNPSDMRYPAAEGPSTKPVLYQQGFEACQAKVLEIMNDPAKRTRAEFVELFKNLKP